MGFSRQENWGGLPFPPPGYLPDPGIEPVSLASATLQVDSLPLYYMGEPHIVIKEANPCRYDGIKSASTVFRFGLGT